MNKGFDPNGPGIPGHVFGLAFNYDDSEIIIIPVPWDVTVSYKEGTHNGPEVILQASSQVDLYLNGKQDSWKKGIYMMPIDSDISELNSEMRTKATDYIKTFEEGREISEKKEILNQINQSCRDLNLWVEETCDKVISDGKYPVILGGDHSTPLGYIKALSKNYTFGILQIDAHADLRVAYEGFEYSHASIMHNALQNKGVNGLVQVGVRDLCEEEFDRIRHDDTIHTFFDEEVKGEIFRGGNWADIVERIISLLPDNVYFSFDIDGLDPSLCPNTGTPVPGGLSFEMASYLIKQLSNSGKQIIGFDLCEVAPGKNGDWDGNVGARLLYQMISYLTP